MSGRTRLDIEIRAVETYGVDAQTDMVIEEMSELTKALLKLRRAGDGPKHDEALANVIEEAADVQIMLEQLRIMHGIDTLDVEEAKLVRLRDRLDAHDARQRQIEALRKEENSE